MNEGAKGISQQGKTRKRDAIEEVGVRRKRDGERLGDACVLSDLEEKTADLA